MVKKDVEELYNALKEVKNASIKRKIAQVINFCSRHETLVGIVVGVIVITINFSRVRGNNIIYSGRGNIQ